MLLLQHDKRLWTPDMAKQSDVLSPLKYPPSPFNYKRQDVKTFDPRFIQGNLVGSLGASIPDAQFNYLSIRDTATYRPALLTRFQSPTGRLIFQIFNNLNQQISLNYVGGVWNDVSGAPLIAAAGVVAANTNAIIATNVWAPWVGVTVVAASSPTTGSLYILCSAERDPNNPY